MAKFYTGMRYSTVKKENLFMSKDKTRLTFINLENCERFQNQEELIETINKRSSTFEKVSIVLVDEDKNKKSITKIKEISPLTMGSVKNITKKDIKLLFWNNEPYTSKRKGIKSLEKHREENKKMLIIKIGELISFHDEFDEPYILTQEYNNEENDKSCKGCNICDEIQRLRIELEKPWMRRTYYKTYYHNCRFKNENGEMLHQSTEDLSLLLHDYKKLLKSGKNIEEIAEAYGIYAKTLTNILYYVSISPYFKVLGLKEQALHTRKKDKPGIP